MQSGGKESIPQQYESEILNTSRNWVSSFLFFMEFLLLRQCFSETWPHLKEWMIYVHCQSHHPALLSDSLAIFRPNPEFMPKIITFSFRSKVITLEGVSEIHQHLAGWQVLMSSPRTTYKYQSKWKSTVNSSLDWAPLRPQETMCY